MSIPIPKAILFDLDGTLADTAPDLAEAVNQLRVKQGLERAPYEQLRPHASAGARGLIGAAFGFGPEHAQYETLRTDFLAYYTDHIACHTRLFEGITPLLEALDALAIPWGIVTNKAARLTDKLVPQIGLARAACVISGDTTAHPKPHPLPLLEAAARLDVDPKQCWYVGDDLRDVQAGKAAGMTTIAAGWGYCGTSEPASWNADMIINSPTNMQELLRQIVS